MRGVLVDLDGVVYVGDQAVPGARDALFALTEVGHPLLYLTNTTSRPRRAIVEKLRSLGIDADADEVLTPPVAAVAWLREHTDRPPALFVPESTADEFVDLDPLSPEATEGAGAVVVGDLGERWDYPTLNRAFRLLAADPGTPLVALGMTRYWRAEDGLRLDAGAFVSALAYAAGRTPVVLGKPADAFFETAATMLGLPVTGLVMVGDDIRTDVGGAQAAGLTGVLVRTGKFSPSDLDGDVRPDAVLESIADLPAWIDG